MVDWNDVVKVGNKYGFNEVKTKDLNYIERDPTLIPATADLIFYSDGIITDTSGCDVTEGRTYLQMISILENLYGVNNNG